MYVFIFPSKHVSLYTSFETCICLYIQRSIYKGAYYILAQQKFDPVAYIFQNPNNKTIKLTQSMLSDLPQDPTQKQCKPQKMGRVCTKFYKNIS